MALLNFTGFETGDGAECAALSGAASVQSGIVRTGTYAMRVNRASGTTKGYAQIGQYGSNGKPTTLPTSWAASFYFYVNAFPSNNAQVLFSADSIPQHSGTAFAHIGTSGAVTGFVNGTGSSYTVSIQTWYRMDIVVVQSGATTIQLYDVAGSLLATIGNGTADATNPQYLFLGEVGGIAASSYDVVFDDVAIDDSAAPGKCEVKVAVPTGNSATNTAWSASTGNKWACVDELPPSATDYIESLTTAGDRRYSATHASCATLGVVGSILGVKAMAVLWEPTSTTTLGAIGIRSGSTNFEKSNVDIGTTAEVTMARVDGTDPNTSSAWTTSGVDAAEPLVKRSTSDTSNIRCKWLGLMILSRGLMTASVSGNQPAASGALADITIIPSGVTVTGSQPSATGTVVSTRFKSLAGNQPAATGTVVALFKNKLLAGNQPNATGALTVRRTLTHITLAGNQPNATGAIAAIKTQFKSLAGNQPAGSGALAFDIILRHITLAGNQPAGSGTIAAVRAKFISLAGNQPNATGALVALFKNKLLQGAQAAPSGSIAFDRLLSHISLAGNQAAPSGTIAAVSATFVDLAGNQPAASGALVALFTSKLLQGNQPNATGVLAALHLAFVALAGDQPAGSGTVVGVAPVRNYTPSPYGGSARATLQPLGASGRVTDVRPSPGTVRTNNPPNRGSARFTP